MTTNVTEVDKNRLAAEGDELADRIGKALTTNGVLEIFPGIALARSCASTTPLHSVFTPAFCVIAQGRKRVSLGDESFVYDKGRYLIATVDLPISSCVVEASDQNPYLSFRLDLEPSLLAEVLMESGLELERNGANVKAMDVSTLDADLLSAVVRILRLLEKPGEQQMLLPLIKREIVYRLLKGEQAARLGHLITSGDTRRISMAIVHLKENFDQPLRIEDIARELGMSVSGFHHHFKSVTSMSPLQYQKQIRLQEARRLMLGEDLDAASAGFRVGYEDPSYFSREYKKQFGEPPQRDIARLRSVAAA
ncbi:MAG TPA: AraC family transcriptional regulator [Pyrinomonadaceae bacterium]|nr:AraC family transcriptional regulator [Pyrinomonadaceae bacterium]